MSSQMMLILLVQGQHCVDSPGLLSSITWKPAQLVCVRVRHMPKSARLTPKDNSLKKRGFLLFLQGVVVKFYC